MPAFDILAAGLMRAVPESVMGTAVVFPAIWLGLQFGRRGVALTVAALMLTVLGLLLNQGGPL